MNIRLARRKFEELQGDSLVSYTDSSLPSWTPCIYTIRLCCANTLYNLVPVQLLDQDMLSPHILAETSGIHSDAPQTLTVASTEPDAMALNSLPERDAIVMQVTKWLWAWMMRTHLPDFSSHTRMVQSSDAESRCWPRGWKAIALTQFSWPI